MSERDIQRVQVLTEVAGNRRSAFNFQVHQPLGGKADHLAKQIGIGGLFQRRAKRHHVVGHRQVLGFGSWFDDQTLTETNDDHRCG